MPDYEICFKQASSFDDPLVVGDAIRWLGPDVWRVEAIDGNNVEARIWLDSEPYPALIRDCGPGEWPEGKP